MSPTGAEFDQPNDLAGCRVRADPRRADGQLSLARHRGGEGRFADAAHHRQSLAGDGLLVDQRAALDDLAIDRNHLAGIDDDIIADQDVARGDGNHAAVAYDPGGLRLEFEQIADRALGPGRREIPDPIAELYQPNDQAAGDVMVLRERGEDRQCVEKIHVEPTLVANDAIGSRGDGIAVPQHQRNVDRRGDGIGHEGQGHRHRGQQQGIAMGLLRGLGRGDQFLREMLAGVAQGRRELGEFAQIAQRHQPQPADQQAKYRLERDLIFHDETAAGVIDPRAAHRALAAQPGERLLGEALVVTQRWNPQANATWHEVADRELHWGGPVA